MANVDSIIWTPIVVTFVSVGGAFMLGVLSWGGRRMLNWWRTRIICKRKPEVWVDVIARRVNSKISKPTVQIHLFNADIFTRQPNGYCQLIGQLITSNQIVQLQTEKFSYAQYMPLNDTYTLGCTATDWSFWEKQLLKESILKVIICINDRRCRLVNQKINTSRIQFIID